MKIQPAVKKETGHIACWIGAGTILMIVAFAVCHKLFPDAVPFDYKVVLVRCHCCSCFRRKLFYYGTYGAEDRIRGTVVDNRPTKV